ncbi:MAG: adenosylcobinamide kinase/adenosylcobinamide phosphate guanyltransferase [Thalassobius sp.]|nr:adenosylcobinamide kinase/adenosylcobinamide phosphate guanyltransferase [Thalassovita sp.]
MIVLITGGTRSGKSSFAQEKALELTKNPLYLATSHVEKDPDFAARVERHKQQRGEEWETAEIPVKISSIETDRAVILVDCVTLWLSNIFMQADSDIDQSLEIAKAEIEKLDANKTWLIVTNELGMGLHAETAIGRKFTDLQGFTNQYIAKKADEVFFMVSGIPWKLK